MKIVSLALALLAAPAVAEDQFDLVCSGAEESRSLGEGGFKPYTKRFRIDIANGLYCDDGCKVPHKMQDVNPAQITFEQTTTESYDSVDKISNFVNRETGEHFAFITHSNPRNRRDTFLIKDSGTCAKQPFSGFPVVNQKF